MDNFIMGVGSWKGRQVLVYNRDDMIEHWAEEMVKEELYSDEEEAFSAAEEYFEYNVGLLAIPADVGWQPVYVSKSHLEEGETHESLLGVGFSFGEDNFMVYADCGEPDPPDPGALYVTPYQESCFRSCTKK